MGQSERSAESYESEIENRKRFEHNLLAEKRAIEAAARELLSALGAQNRHPLIDAACNNLRVLLSRSTMPPKPLVGADGEHTPRGQSATSRGAVEGATDAPPRTG